jgi:hypothetical protein
VAFGPTPIVKEHRTPRLVLNSKLLAQSQARKKAPKRIPNSIATNWKKASFISVESVSSNGILKYKAHCSGIDDERYITVLRRY